MNPGGNGVSGSISESKKYGVFISEYRPLKNPIKINDTLKITVHEAWLEKTWAYSNDFDNPDFNDSLDTEWQFCITTEEEDIKGLNSDWSIGIEFDRYKSMISSGHNSLIGLVNTIPSDTIEYLVQQGRSYKNKKDIVILGKIVLIKKK